ncbi:hypothetical protein GCM10018980_67310 [Streptomyces capoamus]|uniref:DUF3073 family protein n=1 Tax=Streptomyces capoamus TaxID=68183 RepID=A0A919F296_9ACTN|nr:hypothetical protein GCM10018980_67310 [Streptomyces capoamus]
MGRGRAKAKQTKVARQLKYNSGGTDLSRLAEELGASTSNQSPRSWAHRRRISRRTATASRTMSMTTTTCTPATPTSMRTTTRTRVPHSTVEALDLALSMNPVGGTATDRILCCPHGQAA